MASYNPIIKNGASGAIFYISLAPRTGTGLFQVNPTLASGDVKVSLDGGTLNNLGTLPSVSPATSKMVKVTLSQAETNADNVTVVFSDVADAEWNDLVVNFQTVARNFDDLPLAGGVADAVWDEAMADHLGAGSTGAKLNSASAPTAAAVADAVWDEAIADHLGAGSTGLALNGASAPSAAVVADAVWDELQADHVSANTFGLALDAAITSRMATFAQPTGFLAATFPTSVASPTNITGGTITTVTDLTNAPSNGDLTAAMKASVNAEVDTALADIHLDHLIGVADPGGIVANNSFLSKLVSASATAVFTDYVNTTDSLQALRDRGDAAWVTAVGFSTHNAAAAASAVRTELTTELGRIDVAVSTRALEAGGNVAAIKAKTDNLPTDPADASDIAASFAALNDLNATEVEDAVWDAVMANHLDSGSTGEALNAAGAAGDPWTTTLPGSYTGAQAGKIIGDNLDVAVSTRGTQYEDAAVWIDTVNGVTGTTSYVHGTQHNPVDSFAEAKTIADALGLKRFRVAPNVIGDMVVISETIVGYSFIGKNWWLNLNGQSITNCPFEGPVVTGTATGTGLTFRDGIIAGTTLPSATVIDNCGLLGPIVLGGAGSYYIDKCYSAAVDPEVPPIVNFGTTGGQSNSVQINHYSGGIELQNIGQSGTDMCTVVGWGRIDIDTSCNGGDIYIRGIFNVNNASTSTVTEVASVTNRFDDVDTEIATRMPTTHIDATVGKVNGVALVDVTTLNSDMRGTDGASTHNAADAATAVRSELAVELALIDAAISSRLASAGYTAPDNSSIADILTDTGTTLDALINAIKAKTDLIPGTQDGLTYAESHLLMACALLAKVSGLDAGSPIFRSIDDLKDRITATSDANGNRSAVTLDPS
jgi:hypothetical protein